MSTLPVVGVALTSHHLSQHLDWILADQRDLEIQDITDPDLLDDDWQARAYAIREMLQAHTGRRGIHGPFYGIDIGCKDRAIQAVVQQRLLQGLEFAQIVGASHMVVHSPFMAFGSPFSAIQPKTLASTIKIANHIMAPVVAKAAEIGCLLVIETIQDQHPQHLRSLITSFD
jgi:sugar phosphate isomerase/epimerase